MHTLMYDSSFVLRLGKFICVPILSEWLSVNDFVFFDLSLCRSDQLICIQLVREFSTRFAQLLLIDNHYYRPEFIRWASIRNIDRVSLCVTNVVLRHCDINNIWSSVRRFFCSRILSEYCSILCDILSQCRLLEDITIYECDGINDCVLQLAKSCPRLTCVDFGSCVNLTDDSFVALCQGCPSLESAKLWRCSLGRRSTLAVAVHCRRMKNCDIEVEQDSDGQIMCFHSSYHWQTMHFLRQTSSNFKNFVWYRGSTLTELDSVAYSDTYESLHMCPQLTSLELYLDIAVCQSLLKQLCQFSFLTQLDITSNDYEDLDLTTAIPALNKLDSLKLVLHSSSQYHAVLPHCRSVRTLSLVYAAKDVLVQLQSFSKLTCLSVAKSSIDFAEAKLLKNLTELSLESCEVSDYALEILAVNCPGLIYVDLYRCQSITDQSLCALLSYCTTLEVLAVCHCGITSKILDSLLQHSTKCIKEVSIDNRIQYNYDTIVAVLEKCKRLVRLQLVVTARKLPCPIGVVYSRNSELRVKHPDVYIDIEVVEDWH